MALLLLSISGITSKAIAIDQSTLWARAANLSGSHHNAILAYLGTQSPVPQDGLWTRSAFENMLSSGAAYAVRNLGSNAALTVRILEDTKKILINDDTRIVKQDRNGRTAEYVRYNDLNDLIDLLGGLRVNGIVGRRLRVLHHRLKALGSDASDEDVNGLVNAFVNTRWPTQEKRYVQFFSNVFEASSRYWDGVSRSEVSVSLRKRGGKWKTKLADAIGALVGGVVGGAAGGPSGAGVGAAVGGAVASHIFR